MVSTASLFSPYIFRETNLDFIKYYRTSFLVLPSMCTLAHYHFKYTAKTRLWSWRSSVLLDRRHFTPMPNPKLPRSAARAAIPWPTGISEDRAHTGNSIQAMQNGQAASLHLWVLCATYTALKRSLPIPSWLFLGSKWWKWERRGKGTTVQWLL